MSDQSLYKLSARSIELEVIPACRQYGLALLPWSPLGGGLLGGVLGELQAGRRLDEGFARRVEKHRARLGQYEAPCRELGEEPGTIALAWLLAIPAVTAPIFGPRMVARTESAVHRAAPPAVTSPCGSDR